VFANRAEAGKSLAKQLGERNFNKPVIWAIPRGGVVVAEPVASALGAGIELVIPRKVGTPWNPEVAMAAVAPDGTVIYHRAAMAQLGLTVEDLKPLIAAELKEIGRRMDAYGRQPSIGEISGRTAILIDDGIATGLTIKAALAALRKQNPDQLILAVPVAPRDTVEDLKPMVDDLICLLTPDDFIAVGEYYVDFGQTGDEEVLHILRNNRSAAGHNTG